MSDMNAFEQGYEEFVSYLLKKQDALEKMGLSDEAYDKADIEAESQAYKEGFKIASIAGYKKSEFIFIEECKDKFENECQIMDTPMAASKAASKASKAAFKDAFTASIMPPWMITTASKAPSTKVSMTAAEMVKATLVERAATKAASTKVSVTAAEIVKSPVVDKAISNAVDTKVATETYWMPQCIQSEVAASTAASTPASTSVSTPASTSASTSVSTPASTSVSTSVSTPESTSASTLAFNQGYKKFINILAEKESVLNAMDLSDEVYIKAYDEAKVEAYKAGFTEASMTGYSKSETSMTGYSKSETSFNSDCQLKFECKDPLEIGIDKALTSYATKCNKLEEEYIDEDDDEYDEYGEAKKEAYRAGFKKALAKGYSKSEALFNKICDIRWEEDIQKDLQRKAEFNALGAKVAAKAVEDLYKPGGMLFKGFDINEFMTAPWMIRPSIDGYYPEPVRPKSPSDKAASTAVPL